jgi:ABC-type branched-subunit amino acid transport system permease subunit
MRKALLGAFVLGTVFGVLQTEHPWRGKGILANAALVIGCGLGVAALVAIIWSLTVLRLRAAALIWRKGA